MRFLNLHAPGQQFVDYMRAMRDGSPFTYDQHPPSEDGGRPRSEAVIGGTGYVAERPGLRVELLTDIEEIGISESVSDPGEPSPPLHLHRCHVESF